MSDQRKTWTARQLDEARAIWAHAKARARWLPRDDARFRHWRGIPEVARAIGLASRAGLPADLIVRVSGLTAREVSGRVGLMRCLCRMPGYRPAAEALTEMMPAFGLAKIGGLTLADHRQPA